MYSLDLVWQDFCASANNPQQTWLYRAHAGFVIAPQFGVKCLSSSEPFRREVQPMSSSGASAGSDDKPSSPTKNLVLNDERRMLALNAAQMGTWLWDLESQSIHWDDQGRRLFGQPEGSTGASIEDFLALLHPDDRKPTREAIEDAVEKRSDYDMIHRIVWPDGSVHWLRCKGKVEPGAKCILGLTIEINWLKRAEELMRYQRTAGYRSRAGKRAGA